MIELNVRAYVLWLKLNKPLPYNSIHKYLHRYKAKYKELYLCRVIWKWFV